MYVPIKISPKSLSRFADFNAVNTGVEVELSYLQNAEVYAMVHILRPKDWVACFVVNTTAPFRCLSFISSESREELLNEYGIGLQEIVEVTCLCRDKQTRWSQSKRWMFYLYQLLVAWSTKRRIVLGATIHRRYKDELLQVLQHPMGVFPFSYDLITGKIWIMYGYRSQILSCLWDVVNGKGKKGPVQFREKKPVA